MFRILSIWPDPWWWLHYYRSLQALLRYWLYESA